MKSFRIKYIIPFFLFYFSSANIMAQAPEGINYQAVFRSSNGNIVAGQQLSCRVEIVQGNISGLLSYSEKHGPTTNQQGIANFIIGGGQTIQGVFADIDWGNGPYYMKLYVDFDGQGSLFQMQQYGVQQLISVPYALHAKVADSIAGGGSGSGTNGQDGEDGLSAYELAVNNGFIGTETEWLASLQGLDGEDGQDGADGVNGQDGADGVKWAGWCRRTRWSAWNRWSGWNNHCWNKCNNNRFWKPSRSLCGKCNRQCR